MKMTEKEAQRKWCPFARVLLPINQSGNRIGTFHKSIADDRDRQHYEQQEADCCCIGSRCMAWRWSHELLQRCHSPVDAKDIHAQEEPPRPQFVPVSWKWVPNEDDAFESVWLEPLEEAQARALGFCGLANRPEVVP